MKHLITSDWHLGSPLFIGNRGKLHHLLEETECNSLILLGDIIDVWEDKAYNITYEYQSLINLINKKFERNLKYILGNHDPMYYDIKATFPKVTIYELEYKDKENSIIFLHGDKFDKLILNYSPLAKFLFYINWVTLRLGFDLSLKFRKLFYSVAAKKKEEYYNKLVLDIESETIELFKSDYKNIIMGHTHWPKILYHDCGIYMNCGDMVGNFSYIIFDDRSKTLDLYNHGRRFESCILNPQNG